MSCNEWQTIRLGDVIECIIDNRGKTPPVETIGFELIETASLVGDNKYPNFEKITKYVSKETYNNWFRKGHPKVDDILIALVGANMGNICIVNEERGCIAQNLVALRMDTSKCNPNFIYYFISSDEIQQILKNWNRGSAQPSLKISDLVKLEFKLPPLEEQEKIASILSSLDDKIELNNEMNKTLEEMAQSLFKRWFIDFEFPNEDGEPYKSSGGEMVDSELGMIPKGWEVKCIGDIGNVITGKTPSAKVEGSYGDECNFITPRDITNSPIIMDTERKLSSIGINNLKKNLVCKNSIGVSCIGSNLGEVYITGENSITNQQINTLVLKEGKIYPYVYIYLKNMKEEFLNMAGGSAVPIINKTSFSGINILMPDMYILNKFVQSTTCYFERIEENLRENESLITLRDSLLPKLMSGEISLNNII